MELLTEWRDSRHGGHSDFHRTDYSYLSNSNGKKQCHGSNDCYFQKIVDEANS